MRAWPLSLVLVSCASQQRFPDRDIVWAVDDMKNIAPPAENPYANFEYMANVFFLRRSTRALELNTYRPAIGTNALDEVPDSSWFTNRIGKRTISPDEAAHGCDGEGPPVLPFVVVAAKSGGGNPGFVVKDASGRKFLVKFDTHENPEQQTATDAIVARIFWTLGYHVPADYVLVFARDEITAGPDVKDVDLVLDIVPKQLDGKYRAIASEFLLGKPLGGVPPEGVREDDPNDRIPHQHRRELRAMSVIGAWLNHTDMKEDNTLDVLIEENGKKFVRHYFVDFGEAFGAHASEKGRFEDGYEHYFDWKKQALAFFSFGLWIRPWEWLEETPWPVVGAFSADHFDPTDWREAYPYWPITEAGPEDHFWAAKLVMRFDRPILEAIVKEAQISAPEAAAYLIDTLMARRDAVGRAFLGEVTPLDEWTIEGDRVCAVDLWVRHGFGEPEPVIDGEGHAHTVEKTGRVCIPLPASDDYTVIKLRAGDRPYLELHVKGGRILGLIRRS